MGVFVVVSTKMARWSRDCLFGVMDSTRKSLRLRLKRGSSSGYKWLPLRRVFITSPVQGKSSRSLMVDAGLSASNNAGLHE